MGKCFGGKYRLNYLYLVPTFWYCWKALSMLNQSCFIIMQKFHDLSFLQLFKDINWIFPILARAPCNRNFVREKNLSGTEIRTRDLLTFSCQGITFLTRIWISMINRFPLMVASTLGDIAAVSITTRACMSNRVGVQLLHLQPWATRTTFQKYGSRLVWVVVKNFR